MAGYTPRWLPLAQVPAFIGATEQDLHGCRRDICNALSDHEIAVRATIGAPASPEMQGAIGGAASVQALAGDQSPGRASAFDGRVFEGDRVDVPEHLHPDDFDWERSCPKRGWYIRGDVADRLLPIGLLELSTKDLVRLFGNPQLSDVTRADIAPSAAPLRKPDGAGGRGELPVAAKQFEAAEEVLPLLAKWATWRYGGQATPSRERLLHDHRADYGVLPGISEPVMRKLRRKLATAAEKRGGAPTQNRYQQAQRAASSDARDPKWVLRFPGTSR